MEENPALYMNTAFQKFLGFPAITSFDGEYSFLSNFYEADLIWMAMRFKTAEHAYQASKTDVRRERFYIQSLETAGKAKRAGAKVTLREGWDNIKIATMEGILRAKFSDQKLKTKLMETKACHLIEGNKWGDTFWGCVKGRDYADGTKNDNWYGRNNLGILLMKLRAEFLYDA